MKKDFKHNVLNHKKYINNIINFIIINNNIMKLFILRHEERTNDATFFSPLTEKGLINANNLVSKLEKLKITKIYCSPYIRTLQTIYPFSIKNKIKLNLEYNLIEIQHQNIIAPKSHGTELPLYMAKSFNYNPEYISAMNPDMINYPETFEQVEYRTKQFLKALINKYYNTNEVILLVTHQSLCQVILNIIKKFGKTTKPDETLHNTYPMGTLSLVFDNNQWVYQQI
jgi:broad specificity phosphatase PhoE